MMGNPPVSVNDFLIEVRRLENIADSLADPVKEDGKKAADDTLFQAVEALTNQVAILTRSATRPVSPGLTKPAIKQVGFERHPPGSRNEIHCYNCNDFGHFLRDCPHPNPR
jgi:hypothetical protein